MTTEETSEDQKIPLRYFQESPKIEIGMIRKSKPLSKITSFFMKKERKKILTLKFIVLETPPHFPF
jgi:hypothetical protein